MQKTDSLVSFSSNCFLVFVFLSSQADCLHGSEKRGNGVSGESTSCHIPSWYLQIWPEGERIKGITRAPLKSSNLVWNHCMQALWSANGQAAVLQPAISPHYRWEPHSQHCAHPSTWLLFDLFTELIFQQISLVLCHELPLSISRHTCLAASLPLFACTQPPHTSRDKQQVLHITQSSFY